MYFIFQTRHRWGEDFRQKGDVGGWGQQKYVSAQQRYTLITKTTCSLTQHDRYNQFRLERAFTWCPRWQQPYGFWRLSIITILRSASVFAGWVKKPWHPTWKPRTANADSPSTWKIHEHSIRKGEKAWDVQTRFILAYLQQPSCSMFEVLSCSAQWCTLVHSGS